MVDMDAVTQSLWTKNNDAQLVKTLVQQVGMMTSALEHRIPELLFTNEENPGEAVSAVKALALASAQGQRIYQITSENVNTVLPVLNISADVKYEIRSSVAVGKVATVSQNNITVGDWTGVGYIIADPETGAGAYRISGGENGGYLQALEKWFSDGGYGWLLAAFLVGMLGIYGVFAIGVWYALLLILPLLVVLVGSFTSVNDCVDFDWDIFKWVVGIGSIIGGLFKIAQETLGKIIWALVLVKYAIDDQPFGKEYPAC